MPRQGWETNKAGGKGPAVARESDKSQPQPGCPAHPCIPLPCIPQPVAPEQRPGRCPAAPAGRHGRRSCGKVLPGPVPAGHAEPGQGRAPALPPSPPRTRGRAARDRRAEPRACGASAGRAAWQADGWQLRFNSTSLFSQTNPVGFS